MPARIGDLRQPAGKLSIEILEIEKAAGEEEVLADIAIGSLDLALGLGPVRLAGPRLVAIVIGECDERRVVDRASRLVVAQHHRLHPIVEDLLGNPAERRERVDVTAQHCRELLVRAEPAPQKAAVAERRRVGCGAPQPRRV
jgi:hypothetical protein